ncbi:hypothetical protein MAR_020113 [Mya arenaria]|uniref:Uncharacterized protein n=1 Tax=Mya arenaria TaxID=6604 RepID=A0ABY7E8L6_MYAAR|nr:hypothetical protein MAR_020113 [Mya arenaria]
MHDRFADNDDAAILTAMSNIFNPVVQKTDKANDVVVASEYLCSLGYDNCREDLELFMSSMHSLVDSGSKVVKHTKDAANLVMKKKDMYPAAAELALETTSALIFVMVSGFTDGFLFSSGSPACSIEF